MLTPKLWALLDPACREAYFGTLESQIGQTVLELLRVDQNSNGQMNERTNEWTDERKPHLI